MNMKILFFLRIGIMRFRESAFSQNEIHNEFMQFNNYFVIKNDCCVTA